MANERPEVPAVSDIPTGATADIIDEIVPDPTASRERVKEKAKGEDKGGFGNNRTVTGTVPQLKPADKEKIMTFYRAMAFGIRPFSKEAAETVFDNSEECADAWLDLARENVKVRRFLLAMMEGSAWSQLIAAHLPIVIACVPASTISKLPFIPQMPDEETDQ